MQASFPFDAHALASLAHSYVAQRWDPLAFPERWRASREAAAAVLQRFRHYEGGAQRAACPGGAEAGDERARRRRVLLLCHSQGAMAALALLELLRLLRVVARPVYAGPARYFEISRDCVTAVVNWSGSNVFLQPFCDIWDFTSAKKHAFRQINAQPYPGLLRRPSGAPSLLQVTHASLPA